MYRAIFIVVLFAFSASALNKRDDIAAGISQCRKDYGIGEDVPISLSNLGPLIEAPETRCFTGCILLVIETFNADGTLNIARLSSLMAPDYPERAQTIQALETCAKEKGENPCETAYKIYKCIPGNK